MASTKNFDVKSPGFIYTIIVSILVLIAGAGVHFPTATDVLAGQIMTSLSSGGIYALIGVVISGVVFPVWNAIRAKTPFSWKNYWSSTFTWIALINIVLALLALTGLVLPEGTAEQIVGAIQMKDWTSLFSLLVTTILPTVVRWIKDMKKKTAVA